MKPLLKPQSKTVLTNKSNGSLIWAMEQGNRPQQEQTQRKSGVFMHPPGHRSPAEQVLIEKTKITIKQRALEDNMTCVTMTPTAELLYGIKESYY